MKKIGMLLLGWLALTSCARYQPEPYSAIQPAQNVKLPALFSDNMVLQRDMPIPIWGTAEPGGKVTVLIGDEKEQALVHDDGTWEAILKPHPAGGPIEITISGETTITLKNVLIGDVWICSGQSNMEFTLRRGMNAEAEIAAANYTKIRLITVEQVASETPLNDITTTGWESCSPQTAGNFSAVGYFFGREIEQHHDIPLGLIHSSWGGTSAEAWTSMRSLKLHPDFQQVILKMEENSIENRNEM